MTIEDRRLKFDTMCREVLGSDQVFCDPPATVSMNYPAIVYDINNIDTARADNIRYITKVAFSATLIRWDDGDDLLDRILDMPYTKFDRRYKSDNLIHDVFTTFI